MPQVPHTDDYVFLDSEKIRPKPDSGRFKETKPVKLNSKTIQVAFVDGRQREIPWALNIIMREHSLSYEERFIGVDPETPDLTCKGFINLDHVLELQINTLIEHEEK